MRRLSLRVRDFVDHELEASEHSGVGQNAYPLPDQHAGDTEDTQMSKTKMSHPFRISLN